MDFAAVCRTCLSDSDLNPIFQDPEEEMQYSAAIYVAAGVKVEPKDRLPQQMCSTCLDLLNKHLQFRKQCKHVETELFKYKNISKYVDEKQLIQIQPCKIEIIDYGQELTLDNDQDITEDMKSECTEYLDEEYLDEKPLNNLIEHNIYDKQFSIKKEKTSIEECIPNEEYLELEDSSESEVKYNLTDTDKIGNILLGKSKDSTKTEEQNKCENNITKEQSDILLEQAECDVETQLTYPLASGRVKCRLCSKVLSATGMNYHMARKHPQVESSIIKCDHCDRYLKKTGLARHNLKAHGGTKSTRCVYCKEEWQNEGSLLKHICSVRSDKNKLMAECDVCHKTMQKASLRLHKAVKHAGLKPVCEHCGRSFGNTYRLKEHYRSKHGYDKIKCDKCPFQSSSALAMQNHERRHLGEKPFACECGAKFHAAYLLAQHRQTHRDKLYKCDQCPKSFKVNNSLHLHKATCHSKTQVKCHMCDKTYSNRHYVVKHLRHTHGYLGTVPVLEKVDDIGPEKSEIGQEKS